MINEMSKVVYLTVAQVPKAISLCLMAQSHMPTGKRFGALVWGQSGIGKNAVTDKLGDLFGKATGKAYMMYDCNLSACAPEDITGLPIIQNGKTVDIPRYAFPTDSYGIIRLDEMDRPAYRQNLVAIVKYALDKTVDNPLPSNWMVLGLGNGMSDEGTQPLTEHIKGRFCHLYVSMNTTKAQEELENVYRKQGMPEALIKLHKMNPLKTRDEFEEIAVDNPRGRMYAGAILKAYEALKEVGADYSDVLLAVLAGTIGKVLAVELLTLNDLANLPDLDAVIANPKGTEIPNDLGLRCKYLDCLVATAQGDCNKAVKLLDYLVRYPAEIARNSIEQLATSCPKVTTAKTYVEWSNRMSKV